MTFEHYIMARNRIDQILLDFDFDTVHQIMEMMDWKWASWEDEEGNMHADEIPSVYAIRSEALRLMLQCLDEQIDATSGGLHVHFGSEEDMFDDNYCYMSLEYVAVENSI